MFGEGISRTGEITDLATNLGIIQKSGSWFRYENNNLAQGRDAVKALLKDNPELLAELEEKVMNKISQDKTAVDSAISTADPSDNIEN